MIDKKENVEKDRNICVNSNKNKDNYKIPKALIQSIVITILARRRKSIKKKRKKKIKKINLLMFLNHNLKTSKINLAILNGKNKSLLKSRKNKKKSRN
jgi:hypothetical protein